MSEWTSVKDKFPEKDVPVWYFFEHTGVSQGEFFGFYGCYEGYVDADGNDASMGCKLPDCGYSEGCTGIDYFGGERGVLGGDVTHWMPYTGMGMDKPDPPVNTEERDQPEGTILMTVEGRVIDA